MKCLFENTLKDVFEKTQWTCAWKTQRIMWLKNTKYHVLENHQLSCYYCELCWRGMHTLKPCEIYPIYVFLHPFVFIDGLGSILIVWLENKSLGVKSDEGIFIQAFSKFCSLNLILCSSHIQRIFLFRISTLSMPVMKRGYINNLTPTAKGCIAPYMTPHVFQSQKNIYPCFSKCPPYICQ